MNRSAFFDIGSVFPIFTGRIDDNAAAFGFDDTLPELIFGSLLAMLIRAESFFFSLEFGFCCI